MQKNYARHATFSFLLLIGLTLVSAATGQIMTTAKDTEPGYLLLLVLLTIAFKGQQIVDIFMELQQAPRLWRVLLLGYVTVIPLLIGLIYWL